MNIPIIKFIQKNHVSRIRDTERQIISVIVSHVNIDVAFLDVSQHEEMVRELSHQAFN